MMVGWGLCLIRRCRGRNDEGRVGRRRRRRGKGMSNAFIF